MFRCAACQRKHGNSWRTPWTGASVLGGCRLACHHIRAKPHLHAWHVSGGSRTGSGYFSARQTLRDSLPRTKAVYNVINPSATLHSIYFWGWFIFSSASSPTSCRPLAAALLLAPPAGICQQWPPTVLQWNPASLPNFSPNAKPQMTGINTTSLPTLPRPVFLSLPPPFLSRDSPLWTPRECRTSAHVSACLWVCCRCVSSCPLVITLPPPSVHSVPTIGPIPLPPLLLLRGDLRSAA